MEKIWFSGSRKLWWIYDILQTENAYTSNGLTANITDFGLGFVNIGRIITFKPCITIVNERHIENSFPSSQMCYKSVLKKIFKPPKS